MGDLIIDPQIEQAVNEKTKKMQKDISNIKKIIKTCLCKDCKGRLTCEEKLP